MANGLPYIPEFITVHLGAPEDDTVPDVTVPFIDYVKNVASSEIYPTWPTSALRANMLAQISFALNRVYTEYYRSRGYSFNITNSTAVDQAFVYGRNIFRPISELADEVFNDYIRRVEFVEPLFALYCNGTTVTCAGLSQWGTVDLAEEGADSVDILKTYYGDNIELVTDAPVQGITSSPPIRPLRLGTVGNQVLAVQNRLNRVSVNYPSVPKIPDPDGYFGIETRDAVEEFQRIFGLTVDGIVGRITWYQLERIYAGVKRLNELNSEGLRYDELPMKFPEVLAPGDEGEGVRYIQLMLSYLNQFSDAFPPVPTDGFYGEETENAVRIFQKNYGLPETGITDDRTYARLFDVYNSFVASLPDDLFEGSARPYPGYILSRGFTGEAVEELQSYLVTVAGVWPTVPAPAVTGEFDEATEEAVRAVQVLAGLPVTGRVGADTWQVTAELYNDIIAGSRTAPGQYPGYTIE